ncbi:MAG: DUF4230 domain-containing protein [Lactimicrobium sp.]|jgi:hypothetical protein|uniref:DUF4230 domain-containing protein n=1 Tax=Lactimicrobium sp. TaxID=2563780 RepID=UPI002F35D5AE
MIDKAVARSNRKGRIGNLIVKIVVIAAIVGGGFYAYHNLKDSVDRNFRIMASVDTHDLTLENNGIFGYKAADFADVILGECKRQTLLIVDEQEVSVPSTITDAGFMKLGLFSKTQNLTLYGTGTYTIDLSKITADDVVLDDTNFTITINVPYPELHTVAFDPTKTVIGDTERGWLAFGNITMNAKQQKEFETTANEKLSDRLNQDDCFDKAARYTKLSATELFQPIIERVSPAYKINIQVAQKPLE